MTRILVSLLSAVTLCHPSAARDTPFAEQVDVEWVLVPTVVRQGARLVRGLSAEDFVLEVDGRRVKIGSFESSSDAPIRLIHLQDLSGSMALDGKLATSRSALSCFLRRSHFGDLFALASFASGRTRVDVPFTSEAEALREAMSLWRGYGTTALHDAVAWLPEIAAPDQSTRAAVVLVTDGADNASRLSAPQARELIRRAKLPVYVLGLSTGSPFVLAPDGKKLYRYADVLNLLAHLSGGRYFSIQRQAGSACNAIVDELRSQYVLGFPTRGSGSRRVRNLSVTVSGRSVEVLHRREYSGHAP